MSPFFWIIGLYNCNYINKCHAYPLYTSLCYGGNTRNFILMACLKQRHARVIPVWRVLDLAGSTSATFKRHWSAINRPFLTKMGPLFNSHDSAPPHGRPKTLIRDWVLKYSNLYPRNRPFRYVYFWNCSAYRASCLCILTRTAQSAS